MDPLEIREMIATLAGWQRVNPQATIAFVLRLYTNRNANIGLPPRYYNAVHSIDDLPPFEKSLNLLRWFLKRIMVEPEFKERFMFHLDNICRETDPTGRWPSDVLMVEASAKDVASAIVRTYS